MAESQSSKMIAMAAVAGIVGVLLGILISVAIQATPADNPYEYYGFEAQQRNDVLALHEIHHPAMRDVMEIAYGLAGPIAAEDWAAVQMGFQEISDLADDVRVDLEVQDHLRYDQKVLYDALQDGWESAALANTTFAGCTSGQAACALAILGELDEAADAIEDAFAQTHEQLAHFPGPRAVYART